MKKLRSLNKYENPVELWEYFNSGRYKGKWEHVTTYKATRPEPKVSRKNKTSL